MQKPLPSPWNLLEEIVVDSYRWLKFAIRQYQLPDGSVNDFIVKLEDDCASVVACTSGFERVVIARQFRPGPNEILNELPGGRIEPGETPEQGAARELLEETGYAGDLQMLGVSFKDAKSTRKTYHFLALNAKKIAEPTPDPVEFIEVIEMPWNDFCVHAYSGQLTDSETALRAIISKPL